MQILINHFLLLFVAMTFAQCNKPGKEKALWESNYTLSDVGTSTKFSLFNQNTIDQNYDEISGLVCGHKNEELIYMVEDKGNANKIFVFNRSGILQTKLILQGLENIDWEDIAIGSGPISGESYIYVADIGDNDGNRNSVRIIRFIEPDLSSISSNSIVINNYDIINFQYPNGAKDAETLLLNPFNKDLIIMTKVELVTRVYQLKYPYSSNMNKAEFIGLLPTQKIVASDISSDGQRIVVKNKSTIYYWETHSNDIYKTLFHNAPKKISYIPEPRGESVGFSKDGKSYFTITETKGIDGAEPILYHYMEN
jgi:hypothetical protein